MSTGWELCRDFSLSLKCLPSRPVSGGDRCAPRIAGAFFLLSSLPTQRLNLCFAGSFGGVKTIPPNRIVQVY